MHSIDRRPANVRSANRRSATRRSATRRSTNRRSAQSLIEVTIGLMVVIPVVLILADLAIVVYGLQLNDSTCQNAARAAASGTPAESQYRAQTIVDRMNDRAQGQLVSHFCLAQPVEMKITNMPASHLDPRNGSQISKGGLVVGTATVTTEVSIVPFLVHNLCGQKAPLKMSARKTFPISYIMPAN